MDDAFAAPPRSEASARAPPATMSSSVPEAFTPRAPDGPRGAGFRRRRGAPHAHGFAELLVLPLAAVRLSDDVRHRDIRCFLAARCRRAHLLALGLRGGDGGREPGTAVSAISTSTVAGAGFAEAPPTSAPRGGGGGT